ncbi:hypothetical protein ABZ897_54230 [Nonomuraea sp. NPDC046802]|uniref:hypothetical protein n=1 Tax=Nonomuraea sp. NPDC046802 TaxID=3154919 RepID=UPI0033E07FBE
MARDATHHLRQRGFPGLLAEDVSADPNPDQCTQKAHARNGGASSFSVTNVGVWRVGIAVESGEVGGSVLQKAQLVDQGKLQSTRCRRASFLADVGRGLARNPKSSHKALSWLLQAEKVAPQRIRNNNSVKDTIGVLLTHAHAAAVSRELRGMAARMGIPH